MSRIRFPLFAVTMAAAGFVAVNAFGQSTQSTSKAGADQVECKDGTMAKKGRGACSGHGGVAAHVSTSAGDVTRVPESGTVLCKDGTSAKKGKGACSHHGGVAGPMSPSGSASKSSSSGSASSASKSDQGTGGSAADVGSTQKPSGTPVPNTGTSTGATPPSGKAAKATARCKDGTLSYSAQHEGACSHHGGVDQWLDQNK